MEYYSLLKRKEILAHATTWANLKAIMLSKICQSQKQTNKQKKKPLYDCTYTRYLEWSNSQKQKVESWLPGSSGMRE